MGLLLLLVCATFLGLSQGQGQMVICFSSLTCVDEIGVMTARACCLNTPGLAYRAPGSEICEQCVVFGFFQNKFTDVEQESAYVVQAGYQKRGTAATNDIDFSVLARDGTAREGPSLDYTVNTTQVTASNNPSVPPDDVEFTFNLDGVLLEQNETFSLELVPIDNTQLPSGDFVYFLNTLNLTIIDNDLMDLALSFESATYFVGESDGSLEVCLVTSNGYASQFSVEVQPMEKEVDNPAASIVDFDPEVQMVTFEPSDSSSRECVEITINDDDIVEPDRQFLINIGDISNDQVTIEEISQSCVTILDDDVPELSLTPSNVEVAENNLNEEVCVVLNGSLSENVQISVTLAFVLKPDADAQATAGSDYNSAEIVTVFESKDEPEQTVCFPIPIIDDSIANEPNEQFSVVLIDVSPVASVINNETCVTIIDNDVPVFNLSPVDVVLSESVTDVEECVSLAQPFSLARSVVVTMETDLKFGASSDATANMDFVQTTFQLTFEPLDGLRKICRNVTVINDEIANEADEQFAVYLTAANPTGAFDSDETCITIIDDDKADIRLTPLNVTVSEKDEEAVVCIVLEGFLARDVIVTADTGAKFGAINEATAGSDYETTTIMATFEPRNESLQIICGPVKIIDDEFTNEPDEQFSVRLISAEPDGNLGIDVTCVTIIDDDEVICPPNAEIIESMEGVMACQCLPGYTGDPFVSCVDIDECLEMTDNCSENADCINTEGSFECVCRAGYTGDGKDCEDIDECLEMTDNCSENADCINTEGSFECVCRAGYTGDGKNCEDIDECLEMTDNCDENADCINLPGTFECICKPGYTGDGKDCEDIDECLEMTDNCSENADCINTEGSFECVCRVGYTGDGKDCKDIDECLEMTDDCSENANCINTEGSFECECKAGFIGDGRICTRNDDVVPCSTCSENADCIITEGSFMCICKVGYTGNGTVCEDIDECTAIDNICAEYVSCINKEGGFRCECTAHNETSCITRDVSATNDFQKSSSRSTSSARRRGRGRGSGSGGRSRLRSMGSGHHYLAESSGSGTTSRSKRSRSSRSSRCTPKRRSSNRCGCGEGYTLDPLGGACVDIDECETEKNDCNLYVKCVNLPGTFKCVCSDCITMDEVINPPISSKSESSRGTKSRSETTTNGRS